jgi:S1-C subfamily serine protease
VGAIQSRIDPATADVVSTLANGTGAAEGTGIVLTSTGEILTNNHVIDGGASIKVTDIGNGTTYPATVAGYDQSADVAVLQLQGASGLRTADIGDSSTVSTGDPVTALGNAGGTGGPPAATSGEVTALNQSIIAADAATGASEHLSGLIESNTQLQAGDSGGPLVDIYGQVVAMDSAASSGLHPQVGTSPTTHSYSIPINQAIRLAKQMEAGHASATVHVGTTGILGVVVGTNGRQGNLRPGAQVFSVQSGSPAARAGLGAGDVITTVGRKPVDSSGSISAALSRYHPGDTVTVTWTDLAGQGHHSTIALTTGPAA